MIHFQGVSLTKPLAMKVKVFKVRLVEAYREQDQKVIDDFLMQVEVAHTNSGVVSGYCAYWTMIILYVEKPDEEGKH